MSDANLLIFGCAVSFVALAGFYLYLREAFMRGDVPNEAEREPVAGLKTHVEMRP
jgi:hypothetical protein